MQCKWHWCVENQTLSSIKSYLDNPLAHSALSFEKVRIPSLGCVGQVQKLFLLLVFCHPGDTRVTSVVFWGFSKQMMTKHCTDLVLSFMVALAIILVCQMRLGKSFYASWIRAQITACLSTCPGQVKFGVGHQRLLSSSIADTEAWQ